MTEKSKVTTIRVLIDTREADMDLADLSRRIRKVKAEAKSIASNAPFLCPVCEGRGRALIDASRRETITCHGCGGKGWVR